jgi:hypothetical protein
MRLRPFSRFTLLPSLLVALGATAAAAGAQASTHVGGRVGYNFDTREVMFSANLTVPMTSRVEFYPSIDIYAPDQGNRIGYNGDVKVSFPMTSGPRFYAGGGLGVVSRTVGDFSNTDVGANLLLGLESRTGWVHPFVEGKVLLHDNSQFQLIGGLNLTIGR